MINKNKPKWKYKVDATEFKEAMENKEWESTFIELKKMIDKLVKTIKRTDPRDIDLVEQIEEWTEDLWVEDKDEKIGFVIIKNDDDWEELEYELNNLYDIFDQQKMVWCY